MKSLARGQLLFVYGTLRRESSHPMAQRLAATCDFLGHATIPGKLYLGHEDFPGLIPGEDTAEVTGDLYQVADASLLDVLDLYEGHYYERRRLPVKSLETGVAAAWVYVYQGPVEEARCIAGGDYLAIAPPAPEAELAAPVAIAAAQVNHS